ncbi:hypothetical protein McpCs1_05910 [Methanocorpusculaceae archaeon Cs1]|uniref:Uncharacterized protein n=1 Tax=Methanorbis rubei TaxID=3028300 RepID=A0AAE4SBX9_9EURY|nr:hypothetical protein [Methanocorpusculaceae archaeon Cs1]
MKKKTRVAYLRPAICVIYFSNTQKIFLRQFFLNRSYAVWFCLEQPRIACLWPAHRFAGKHGNITELHGKSHTFGLLTASHAIPSCSLLRSFAGMHGEHLRCRNARKDFRDNLFPFTLSKYEKYIPCIPAPQAFSVHFYFSVKLCDISVHSVVTPSEVKDRKISNDETHHRVSPIEKNFQDETH